MDIPSLINLLVTITLAEMMVAIGLRVTIAELLVVTRNWGLIARGGLANYLCVPAVTVGLLLLFDVEPMVAAGFAILAACPGAPYGPPFTAIAKGDVAVAVGLMVLLAGSSAVVAPLLLGAVLPLLSDGESMTIDARKIVVTLLMTQLLPLSIGVATRQWCPKLAHRLQRPATLLSKLLNLAAVMMILVVQYPLLISVRPIAFARMLALLVASWVIGWLLGGRDPGVRKTMALTTSLRNVAVGLVIATGSFAGTAAVTAVAAYALVSLFGTLALAMFIARVASPTSSAMESSVQ
jgi:BASS family bile acid:Na+ symporter